MERLNTCNMDLCQVFKSWNIKYHILVITLSRVNEVVSLVFFVHSCHQSKFMSTLKMLRLFLAKFLLILKKIPVCIYGSELRYIRLKGTVQLS